MSTRREFVRMVSAAMFVGGQFQRVPRETAEAGDPYPHAGDPHLRELAAAALDAAMAAGATYADVRFTLTDQEELGCGWNPGSARNDWSGHYSRKQGDVGVRALMGGAWGFLSSTLWTREEMSRLGREAAIQGGMNGRGRRQPIVWTPRPAVTGTWVAPVKVDPFTVPLSEKIDVGLALVNRVTGPFSQQHNYRRPMSGVSWAAQRQETTFASTEGSWLTQTRYFLRPFVGVLFAVPFSRELDRLQPCTRGWEAMTDPTLFDELPRLLEEAELMFDAEPPDPNRYDIVCDATVVAQLLAQTVGVATELDRVLGYEANAGGTSYLSPPEEVLGRYALGPSMLNVTANRSLPGLAGTTRWDDEGVEPAEYPVITDGVITGYHTNRELAPVLVALDPVHGRAAGSHGCAVAARGEFLPVVQPPNLVMAPAATDTTFEDLVAGLESGLVFVGGRSPVNLEPRIGVDEVVLSPDVPRNFRRLSGSVNTDRQQLNGELSANFVYEVRKGKRVRVLSKMQVQALFRAPELWKNLQAVGGLSTQMDTGHMTWKGEPGQGAAFGVRACAARFRQVAVTDGWRKA